MKKIINKIRYWLELKKSCRSCFFNFTKTVSKGDICVSCKEIIKERIEKEK